MFRLRRKIEMVSIMRDTQWLTHKHEGGTAEAAGFGASSKLHLTSTQHPPTPRAECAPPPPCRTADENNAMAFMAILANLLPPAGQ